MRYYKHSQETTMENINTPSTPAELLAMQAQPEIDSESPMGFADYIQEVASLNFEPTVLQAVKAAERLIAGAEQYHLQTLMTVEMHPQLQKMWQRDLKKLRKARELLMTIEDC